MAASKEHYIVVPDVEKIGVYAIFNRKTNKYYVGSSVNIKRRMKEHRAKIERLDGSNIKIVEELKAAEDIKNFSFIVLETFEDYTITEKVLRDKEEFYIKKYNAYNGYNDNTRHPNNSGYFGKNEYLRCRKNYNKRRLNIEHVTNKTLLKMYESKLLDKQKYKNYSIWNIEYEILKRMDK